MITRQRLASVVRRGRLELDEPELRQAVRFLHHAGVIVHDDDPTHRLDELYFLDPQWLCRMMAQVISVREINPFISSAGVRMRIIVVVDTQILVLSSMSDKWCSRSEVFSSRVIGRVTSCSFAGAEAT